MMTKNDIVKDLNTYFEQKNACEITIKRARGAKVNVNFQGQHMTHVIFALVYNLKFCI
jgi:translation initiation factor 1 (eIF-1/SUI1)